MAGLREHLEQALAGTYTLERELGGAGMSHVFVAVDATLGRNVVVKVLPPDLAEGLSADRFKREIQLAAQLQHPHIVPLLTAGELPSGVLYYTMPLVEGESLRDRLTRESALPIESVRAILRDVASALRCAHRQHIVHRDIKPENILLSDGGAVVSDFGIAKAISAAMLDTEDVAGRRPSTIRRSGTSIGTPAYMAPEQAAGDAVDHRTDLYALGVVGYEMLAGAHPFAGRSTQQILAAHATLEPEPIERLRPAVPSTLAALVARLLEKRPADRFQSADDILHVLDDGLREPVCRRAPSKLPWIAFGAAAATSLTLAALLVRGHNTDRRPIAAAITAPPAHELIGANHAAFSPDGARLAFVAIDGQGRSAIWIRAIDSTTSTRLERTDGALWPFWSPDGRAMGFFADGQLKVVDLRGGAPRTLCPVSAPSGGTWTANGLIVYALALFGPLYRVPVAGGDCKPLTKLRPTDLDHRRPFALPNGRVLFHGYRLNAMLVADVATGAITEIRRPGRDAQFVEPDWVLFRDEENGPLYAQRLDMKTLKPRGEATVVMPHVLSIPRAFARYAASPSALVADVPAAPGSARLMRVDRRSFALDSIPVPGDATTFALSHSGRFIAFGGFGMWLYDRDRGVLTHLALQSSVAQATEDPAWDPSDSLIAYRTAFAGTRAIRIYHVSSGAVDSIPFPLRAPVTPTWSPDGKRIAFTLRSGDVGTHEEIWIHSFAERRTWRAWEPKSDLSQPVWSPDGQLFAYQSDETGAQEIFIRPIDGSREALRVSTAGGQAPQWRADGRAIFYRAPDGSIIEVSLTRAPELRLSTPRVAVAAAPFASTNRTFAVRGNGDEFFSFARSDPPVFTLLLDWRARLR